VVFSLRNGFCLRIIKIFIIKGSLMKYPNIYSLFRERVEQYSGRNAFYIRQNNRWLGISWDSFRKEAYEFGYALIAKGLQKGEAVSILMGNTPEWPASDIGTIMAGGVSVGLYPTSSSEQCKYIINHSGAKFVLVDSKKQLEKIMQIRQELPQVETVIVLDEAATAGYRGVVSYWDWLRIGRDNRKKSRPVLMDRAESAQPEDIAIMVYTSGTTGLPKGACLSHRYVINSVESLLETIPINDSDRSFSFLPYCHVAERISGLYNRLYAGVPAYFVDDMTRLWDYMAEVRPTIFAGLPRFYEKIHARILADIERALPEEQEQFHQALNLGRKMSRLRLEGKPVPVELKTEYEQKASTVLRRVKEYFGGHIRIATSGGAPLPLEIAEFFDALGITILQAYGLTENVCVAFNRPDNYRFGTVGLPMPGCRVKIAEDGEILVNSEMLFSGYYKEPEKTAEVLRDGWLITGDLGELDKDGFLSITGRKKELIITSTGKNVAPALIENLLKEHPLISQAMAYGDGRSYLVALITLNQIETEEYASARGIEYRDFVELTRQKDIASLVQKIVDGVNSRISSTEAIKKFEILEHDLSIEADEITPTMKIKRSMVTARYKEILEKLYRS
jgi:long-chain acyl-CoA synthetase